MTKGLHAAWISLFQGEESVQHVYGLMHYP